MELGSTMMISNTSIIRATMSLYLELWSTSLHKLKIYTFNKTKPNQVLFAVDLAEMLSTDMKKESLCGRTVTLKLKTASFEVLSDAFNSACKLMQ